MNYFLFEVQSNVCCIEYVFQPSVSQDREAATKKYKSQLMNVCCL